MGRITIVGTGWTEGQLTLDAVGALRSGARILLHTDHSGCADWLRAQGITFESLDGLYEACDDFDEHIEAATAAVLEAAEAGDVVYGVFDIRDRTVPPIMASGVEVAVIPGPPAEGALLALVSGEARCIEASDWEEAHVTPREHCLIREVDSRELAAELKLKLMRAYPEEQEVWLLGSGGVPEKLPLYALDRAGCYDHRTCVLVPAERDLLQLERYDGEHLNEIMRILCAPDGCPWDRVQTHASLRTYMLEEAYEVIDAIDADDSEHLYDELGDVLLQVALHAEIARRHGEFDMEDVTTAICEKMIHRHSHVFGRDHADDPDEVLEIWTRNKMAERGQHTGAETLRAVPRSLPALLRAVKVLKRSRDAGLSSANAEEAIARCRAALDALAEGGDVEARFGSALFNLADAARMLGVDPELALDGAIQRFVSRFEDAERIARAGGDAFAATDSDRLRILYWDSVKL